MFREEQAIHIALALIGGPTTALDLAHGGNLGTRATLAALMLVAGTTALLRSWLRPTALPRARALARRA